MTSDVLATSTLRTVGPRSAWRASCALSMICPSRLIAILCGLSLIEVNESEGVFVPGDLCCRCRNFCPDHTSSKHALAEETSWTLEKAQYSGCSACRCRSFFSWRCSGIISDAPNGRGNAAWLDCARSRCSSPRAAGKSTRRGQINVHLIGRSVSISPVKARD